MKLKTQRLLEKLSDMNVNERLVEVSCIEMFAKELETIAVYFEEEERGQRLKLYCEIQMTCDEDIFEITDLDTCNEIDGKRKCILRHIDDLKIGTRINDKGENIPCLVTY